MLRVGPRCFENSSGRQARGALLLYVGPLVIAAITVIFMIKPFFARMPKAAQPRSLNAKSNRCCLTLSSVFARPWAHRCLNELTWTRK